jgi:hypothetical protein
MEFLTVAIRREDHEACHEGAHINDHPLGA